MHKYEVRVDSKVLGRVRFGFLLKSKYSYISSFRGGE